MLDAARKRARAENAEVTFVQLDLCNLDDHFRNDIGAFDAAICLCESGFGVLGWRKDLKLLEDVYKLLKDNSGLVLTTYNGIKKYREDRIFNKSFNFLEGTSHWSVPDDWNGGEKLVEAQRVYIPSEITLMFRLAGFRDVNVLGCKPGEFGSQDLQPDDTEMMVIGKTGG